VFFREIDDVPADKGPLGAMNRSVTPMRTVAVDPAFTPLGAPVWIEKGGKAPMRRLMVAQDTGSAIKGAQRADIFYGTGASAGRKAGRVRDRGRMVVLLPIEKALALAPGG
jgi:membrane-bound lytic murein transglycosylase A